MVQKGKLNRETMPSNYTAKKSPGCLFAIHSSKYIAVRAGGDNQSSDKWELGMSNKEVPLILIFCL